jgi:signal transduction histidine kinase
VAIGLIDLSYFENLYKSMTIGQTQTMALLHRDSSLVMRVPVARDFIGASIATSPLFTVHLPSAPQGTYQTKGRFDGLDRIVSYASVPRYPLLVTVSVAKSEALAEWRRQLILTSSALLLFLLTYAIVLRLLIDRLESDERRREETDRARAEAVAANRAKSDFLSTMSHELRTPLNAIIGFSEIMADDTLRQTTGEKHREFAAEILRSGRHLLEIINDILDIAKIEAGKLELRDEEVILSAVIDSVMRMVRQRAEDNGIGLTVSLSEPPPVLRADLRACRQILLNLLSNAVKFTGPGGQVDVAAKIEESGALVLTVSDTGIGIAPENLDKIMRPFVQIEGALTRKYEGTGLGLALVKSLVELHGGTVQIASKVGHGTTVTLRFPSSRVSERREPEPGYPSAVVA